MTSHGLHLTESELVDLFDGTLAPARRQHAESCAACAAQAAELATSAADVRQADVPEPPPFFWAQFSARVSEAVSNEAARPLIARFGWARASWLAAASVAVVVILVSTWRTIPDGADVSAPVAVIETAGADSGADALADDAVDFEGDEAWALVRALAEDLDDEQMNDEGVSAGSGAAERMTLQLTAAERVELARLLQEQLRLAGVSESAS